MHILFCDTALCLKGTPWQSRSNVPPDIGSLKRPLFFSLSLSLSLSTQSLTLSRGVQFCTIHRIFNFTPRNFFSGATIICDFKLHHIGHIMTKFEGSSCFASKVTAFLLKVPPAIFVNPGQCPCKSVKTESDVTSSKINIF